VKARWEYIGEMEIRTIPGQEDKISSIPELGSLDHADTSYRVLFISRKELIKNNLTTAPKCGSIRRNICYRAIAEYEKDMRGFVKRTGG
jgi:hypothetical protein